VLLFSDAAQALRRLLLLVRPECVTRDESQSMAPNIEWCRCAMIVIASEAKQSRDASTTAILDCFVASLLAMTARFTPPRSDEAPCLRCPSAPVPSMVRRAGV